MTDFSKAFYTVEELAEVLRVNPRTIYRMVSAKKIDHYKVGAQIRIAAAELEKLKIIAE